MRDVVSAWAVLKTIFHIKCALFLVCGQCLKPIFYIICAPAVLCGQC